jgi:transcriptional regulator with XRE-family HTH domain
MKEPISVIVARTLDGLMQADAELGSQQKLGKKTGIGQTTIGRIRRGESNATIENLKAIAEAFGVTIGQLCGEDQTDLPRPGRWPFSFTLEQYQNLPEREKGRVEGYVEKIIEDLDKKGNQSAAG